MTPSEVSYEAGFVEGSGRCAAEVRPVPSITEENAPDPGSYRAGWDAGYEPCALEAAAEALADEEEVDDGEQQPTYLEHPACEEIYYSTPLGKVTLSNGEFMDLRDRLFDLAVDAYDDFTFTHVDPLLDASGDYYSGEADLRSAWRALLSACSLA